MEISREFKENVAGGNIQNVRSALSGYMIMDPGFQTFDACLEYAARHMPALLEEHDGGRFAVDEERWDKDYMDGMMVELLNNFSRIRIEHLRKVVAKVYAQKLAARTAAPQSSQQAGEHRTGRVRIDERERETPDTGPERMQKNQLEKAAGAAAVGLGAVAAVAGAFTETPALLAAGLAVAGAGGVVLLVKAKS